MADTTFTPGTVVASTWLNDVNDNVYNVQRTFSAAVAKTAQAVLNADIIDIVKHCGAVADGGFTAGGSPSGTDNLAAINVALAAAVATGISRVRIGGGMYYVSAGFTLPRGVNIEGDGTGHLPIFLSGSNRRGTCLLINGAAAGDCIKFEENAGHSGLRDISVYNTNTNAIRSVVSVVGQLYPRMKNVEISSLRKTTGVGLFIAPSTAGVKFATLWGDFDNVMVTCTDVGSGTEASVRWGASIYGYTAVDVANANCFKGGQLAGTWGGLIIDGAIVGSGALSCVFFGVKFDLLYDGTNVIQFQALADAVFGYTKGNVYITPVVQLNKAGNTAFHGCYFESAGAPSTYNDGTNGVQPLLPVVWLDNSTDVIHTGIVDPQWNSVWLFDKGRRTLCTVTTDGQRYDTRVSSLLALLASGNQSIPNTTWTTVQTSAVQAGDDSYIEFTGGVGKVRAAGMYLINAQVEYVGWATAGTYATCRILTTPLNYQGNTVVQQGAGIVICPQMSVVVKMSRGDTVTFQTLHTQGGAQNTTGSNTFMQIAKID